MSFLLNAIEVFFLNIAGGLVITIFLVAIIAIYGLVVSWKERGDE